MNGERKQDDIHRLSGSVTLMRVVDCWSTTGLGGHPGLGTADGCPVSDSIDLSSTCHVCSRKLDTETRPLTLSLLFYADEVVVWLTQSLFVQEPEV